VTELSDTKVDQAAASLVALSERAGRGRLLVTFKRN
jgi:hypothetical protein